ncbi:transglutaminase family protein [Magnetospirillum gryphiswaldense]|uniref:Transglutaminase-like enzymes, putative cysteine proteases n=1 Tax=Magnetospirillum gryphiswaldense TaxID=55518 RepID=A4TX63_9PROT|nr:transglutaminase family protein [Magnetospirillum gryphiswaldense]AVM74519.1 Protein-glutamine gamma-glutamyltransferase [Magnetospirillum gryphiswaldense MSR-1]AVM78422.1 Protein-glutamine gamma-glutamyltransferase [Magnetospirillum gryphiswaldense]CAM75220.1 Transglutaminase-like enzymes, putative cysteine proteases [Magnetospirillum gryphiswaldense MSR-1]
MKYRVRHLTVYEYGEAVLLSHHAAHLRPRQVYNQNYDKVRLTIRPSPAVLRDGQLDYFGNPTTFFTIQDSHSKLEIEASFEVETSPSFGLYNLDGPAWDQVRADLAAATAPHLEEAMDFLFPSPQVPLLDAAAHYAAPSFPPGRPLAQAVLDLNSRIFRDFTFDPVATSIGTPLSTVFAQRRGVCQDFAHAAIACLRAMGLAARYVSGYIRTIAPPGGQKLVGADASHAWASVFIPGWGWLDIDPTNNKPAGEDHVVVAWGRDYDDVSPIKGVVLGGGEHSIHVAVDVTEI